MNPLRSALPLILLSAAAALPARADYHVAASVAVPADGNWDYLAADSANRRVYATHGDRVNVLDMDTLKPVGEIKPLSLPHGIAVAPEFGRGFISNGKTSVITIFDLKTFAVLKTVPSTGKNPDALLYDPFSKRVFAFNGYSDDATVLDAATGAVVGTVKIPGRPEAGASDENGTIFVNVKLKSEVFAFGAKDLKGIAHWPVAPGEGPIALGIDRARNRLFSACHNGRMVVMDASSGKVLDSFAIPEGVDSVTVDQKSGLVLSAEDDVLTLVQADASGHYHVSGSVPTPPNATTMALDPKTGTLFMSSGELGPRPPPTAEVPHPSPVVSPGTFRIVVLKP